MEIILKTAVMADCEEIHKMQIKAFGALFDKYKDVNTSPAVEPIGKIIERMEQEFTDYYLILLSETKIGAMRVVRLENRVCRISPMFIIPEYQGKGYAQQAILLAESLYPKAKQWTLDTIKQEEMLCHLYEKMGYVPTGKEEKIQDGMDIVYYAKQVNF